MFDNPEKYFIIAKELFETIKKKLINIELIKTFKGNILKNYTCYHPITQKQKKIFHGEHVTIESGTGLVHTGKIF
jgi:isoleucyl-tRNA synthetase